MEDFSIQQGETIRLMATVDEEGALTAELVASDGTNFITNTATFDGLEADLTTQTDPDQTPGEYEYYVRITWDDGSVDILTSKEGCEDGDCPMPVITVCEINQEWS